MSIPPSDVSENPSTNLVHYDAAKRELALAHTVDEVKDIRDKAIALQTYAKLAMDREGERQFAEIRIRAEREAGKMLKEKPKDQGGSGRFGFSTGTKNQKSEYAEAKEAAGISNDQAAKWQKLADIPEQQFEDAVTDTAEMPSTSGVLQRTTAPKSEPTNYVPNPRFLFVWGELKDWEKEGLFRDDPDIPIEDVDQIFKQEVLELLPKARQFIDRLEKKLCQN